MVVEQGRWHNKSCPPRRLMLTECEMFGIDTGITAGRARGRRAVRVLRQTLGREGPKQGEQGDLATAPPCW